jgi:tetratricopeptide (TPR) repeat protein
MRITLAWALAGLLVGSSTVSWAQTTTGSEASRASQNFPPLRLAGPATAAPAPAPAAPEPPAPATADAALDTLAQEHYKAGVEMFRNGQYEAARVEFEAAYKLLPLPDLLHNLSMAAEKQGRLADALSYEERFLATAAHLIHSERTAAKERIGRLREAVGTVPQATASGPSPAPVANAPVTGSKATERPIGKPHTPRGALALIGIGSGMLLAGIGCGAGAFSTQKNLESGDPLYQHEIDALKQQGRGLNFAGIGLDVAGGVALVAGSAWAIWARTRGPRPQAASATHPLSVSAQAR